MSEHQYYEFRSIDRRLTADEIEDLGELSSRAEITPTGFSVTYNYSDFRGKPERLMEKYFDAFVYTANWGSRQLMLRLPKRGVNLKVLDDFANETFKFWIKNEFVILSFEYDQEGHDDYWETGDEEWMPNFISLREELLNGDPRPLYLGWLCGAHYDEEYCVDDADEMEPPVPPGLQSLSPAQEDLADFLRLDPVLTEAAAMNSPDLQEDEAKDSQVAKWLKRQPAAKKEEWLLEIVNNSEHSVRADILLEFRETQLESSHPAEHSTSKRRTIKELYTARESQLPIYEKRIAKEAAEEKAKAAKAAAKKKNQELDKLAKRVDEAWKELEARLATTSTNRFIKAVEDLTALRELATRDNNLNAYRGRLEKFLKRHSDKPMLQSRVSKAMLSR
jgi:hypothetical protein